MNRPKTYPAWILFVAVLILDQATKLLIRSRMRLHDSFAVLPKWFGDFMRITHLSNKGAAFSISLSNEVVNRFFFIIVSILAVIFIIYLLYRAIHRIQVWGFGLVLGGAMGNLIDRIFLGSVTDFLDFDIPDMFGMDRFPVFNVADSAIFIGMVLLIIDMIFIRDQSLSVSGPENDETIIEKELIDE